MEGFIQKYKNGIRLPPLMDEPNLFDLIEDLLLEKQKLQQEVEFLRKK